LHLNNIPFTYTNYNEGIVNTVKDGIVSISGLNDAKMGELVIITLTVNNTDITTVNAIILNIEYDSIKALVLGNDILINEGDIVTTTNAVPTIVFNKNLFGKIITPVGTVIDTLVYDDDIVSDSVELAIEQKALGIIDRDSVNSPVLTGILAIDSMIPIGRGQRELIIGDRQTGKTAIVLDTLLNNHSTELQTLRDDKLYNDFTLTSLLYVDYSIYVAIGQKQSTVAQFARRLVEFNAAKNVLIIAANASDSAALQFLAPYAGAAIGEFLAQQGYHAVVIYDDLSKHAVAYRQISLLLRRPPGREAYPGDVFYLHSRLLERAAKLINGGSLTALPIIETQSGDISAYIPTNVISITDGQIFLESELFYKGIRPAINIGLSVSRVGSAAQYTVMKQLAGSLKLELAQYREVEAFASFGSDLDETTQYLIKHGRTLIELLKQTQFTTQNIFEQIILIYAGMYNYLDTLTDNQIDNFKNFIHVLFINNCVEFSLISLLQDLSIVFFSNSDLMVYYNFNIEDINEIQEVFFNVVESIIVDSLFFLEDF